MIVCICARVNDLLIQNEYDEMLTVEENIGWLIEKYKIGLKCGKCKECFVTTIEKINEAPKSFCV